MLNKARQLKSLLDVIEDIDVVTVDNITLDGSVKASVYVPEDYFVEYGLDEGEWSIGVMMTDCEIDSIEYYSKPDGDTIEIDDIAEFVKENNGTTELAENIKDQIGMLEYVILESSKD